PRLRPRRRVRCPCQPGRSTRCPTPATGGRSPRPCPADRAGRPSTTPPAGRETSRRRGSHSIQIRAERLRGDPLIRLSVASGGVAHDLGGQLRRGRLVIPSARVQPVANVLLVEGRLSVA